jgi:hypothetical protein
MLLPVVAEITSDDAFLLLLGITKAAVVTVISSRRNDDADRKICMMAKNGGVLDLLSTHFRHKKKILHPPLSVVSG